MVLTIALLLLSFCLHAAAQTPSGNSSGFSEARKMPASFQQNLIFVFPVTANGDTLKFYTDTGGGTFCYADFVNKLSPTSKEAESEMTILPKFQTEKWIPPPFGNNARLFIMPENRHNFIDRDWTGMLGAFWFQDRVWTIDYVNREFFLHTQPQPEVRPNSSLPLNFQVDSTGQRTSHFPRIDVEIDGQTLPLLLDTGAMIFLTKRAQNYLADSLPPLRATSFIAASIFEQWRSNHPDWEVIEQADSLVGSEPMIRVPYMKIAGYSVGPVWFTRRPDANFHEYMSQWMDETVEGALGGSALQYFIVILSYPGAYAVFETPEHKPK